MSYQPRVLHGSLYRGLIERRCEQVLTQKQIDSGNGAKKPRRKTLRARLQHVYRYTVHHTSARDGSGTDLYMITGRGVRRS